MKKVFGAVFSYIKATDKLLYILCIAASLFSILLLIATSRLGFSTYKLPIMQAVALGLGLGCAVLISLFDYNNFAKLWKIYVPISVVLMVLTFTPIGYQVAGIDNRAWIQLGFTTFQPAEILKIAFVMTFALHLSKVSKEINRPINVLLLFLHAAVPLGMVFLQGDFGTLIIFVIIFIAMMFGAGLSLIYLLGLGVIAAASSVLMWFFVLLDQHKERIVSVFHPELDKLGIGFQAWEGRISLGGGMMFGHGLFNPALRYVPEIYNDFLFAFIGDALGFLGCIFTILLLFSISSRILYVGGTSKNELGRYICTGIFAIIAGQTIVNIGMCLSVLPVIGITLPFLSSGGSSMLTVFLGIGVVLSVYMHNQRSMFSNE